MKNSHITKLTLLCASSLFLMGCENEFDNPVGDTSSYSKGTADFTTYVAVGDSITAGYADAALYKSGQENSFPNILATQFKTVEGGDFKQPLMNDNLGGLLNNGSLDFNGDTKIDGDDFLNRLVFDAVSRTPSPIAGTPINEVTTAVALSGSFNNMGVPGAKSFHINLAGYGNVANLGVSANPYFVRFRSSAGTDVLTDAAAQSPSFFTLWIGNNDVLSYATSGGVESPAEGIGSDNITPKTTVFDPTYAALVASLKTNADTKGVLINIPDVSTLPHFTTVPYNPLTPDKLDSNTIAFSNSSTAYGGYNTGIQTALALTLITAEEASKRTINFTDGANNALVISDEGLTDLTSNATLIAAIESQPGVDNATAVATAAKLINMRQATSNDLILLTTASIIGVEDTPGNPTTTWGVGKPLEDGHVLIPSEIDTINAARIGFNNTIKATADADNNLAFFDASAFMANLKSSGFNYGTGTITSAFVSGGGFSLDGVHPTARGYSVLANGIIDTINTSFGANIPKVDPGTYTTVFLK